MQSYVMSKIEMLDYLTELAKEFREDHDHYTRNAHMHDIVLTPTQAEIDAVLVGFINFVGVKQCLDYALYASDISKEREAVK